MPDLFEIAKANGHEYPARLPYTPEPRLYITPEDVNEALGCNSVEDVRLWVLQALGGECGAEDTGLCAFVAARGVYNPPEEGEA